MNSNKVDKDDDNTIQNTNSDISPGQKNSFSYDEKIATVIQLFAENLTVKKKSEESTVTLSKKFITTTKKIEIPVKYEEVYINDKEFDAFHENEITEIFSKIKDKISDVFSHDKDKNKENDGGTHHHSHDIEIIHHTKDSPLGQRNNPNEKLVPLLGDKNNYNSNTDESIIPIWGEEIIINKRMVKLGEVVVKKYEINEKQKIDVEVKTEQLTIKYPDNHKEEII
jgi:stress response protein YsnF